MAPRNFDQELPDDLTFIAQGETFTMELAGPSVLAKFEDAEDAATGEQAVAIAKERMIAFTSPGDRDRLKALLDSDTIPYVQLHAIQRWMAEVQTGRPTTPPSPSPAGRGGTARTSREK